ISHAISVNHIVDRIGRDTEFVIDELMPYRRKPEQMEEAFHAFPEQLAFVIASRKSGYIRFIDIPRLRALAKAYSICLRLERRAGHFVPSSATLLQRSRRAPIS